MSARVLTLLVFGLGLSSSSCDQRFEYDIPRGGGGVGGASEPSSVAGGGAVNEGAATGRAGAGAGSAAEPCGSGPPCPAGLSCVGETCVECGVDAECTMTGLGRCEPTLHRCVECLTIADCAAGFACDRIANRCLRTCGVDLPCPPEEHGCDEKRMVCYACDEDRECEDSALGPYCAADGSGCVECRGSEGCGADELCDDLTGLCVACRDAGDCDSGLCDANTHTCLAPL